MRRGAARRTTRVPIRVVSLLVVLAGCAKHDRDAPTPREVASTNRGTASAEATPSSSSAPPPGPRASWFAGEWTGSYQAAAHLIDLPPARGGIPDWKADDGKSFVGPGTLELACADDGTVSGLLHGALGEQEIRGESDDQWLHARLVPRGSRPSLAGTLTLSRADGDIKGDLSASSADGHLVRTATVTISRHSP